MSWDGTVERIKQRLHRRAFSYQAIFKTREGALTDPAMVVLRDLERYCYAHKPTLKVSHVTGQSDPLAMAFAEGRRDVLNRIKAMVNLTPEQLTRIAEAKGADE
jgi:hypothetical protein